MCASFGEPKLIAGGWYDHLKYEITEIQPKLLLQVDMAQLISKTIKAIPLSKLHQSHHHDQIFSLRSVSGGVFTASDKGVNIDTNNGRLLISLNDYLLRIQLDCPRYVIAMADEVPYTAGKKRLATAVRRSQTWFTQMKEAPEIDWKTSSLIGVIVGKNTQQFQESVVSQTQFLISNGARGILIGGIGLGETLEERRIVINLVKEARGEADCPLFIQGVQTLEEIRHAASCGIDYISTDYPAILTRSGLVLALNSQENRSEDHVPDGPCVPSPAKKQRLDPATTPSVNLALDSVNILNLWDPIYARDTSPVTSSCSCHACRNYSRAYLHHLLICHELLGEVMLYTHNFHSTLQLFRTTLPGGLLEQEERVVDAEATTAAVAV